MESFAKDKKNINYVQNSAWKNRYGRLDQYIGPKIFNGISGNTSSVNFMPFVSNHYNV